MVPERSIPALESAPIWPKAGPYIRVNRVGSAMFGLRPLCPEQPP